MEFGIMYGSLVTGVMIIFIVIELIIKALDKYDKKKGGKHWKKDCG